MINLDKIETIVTHNGIFHADEIFAIAFINIATNRTVRNLLPVVRVGSKDLNRYIGDESAIILDIGGGEFDHHGTDREYRSYRIRDEYKKYPFASFGKVVREFHTVVPAIADDKSYRYFDRSFVCRIDAYDNGDRTQMSDFSQIINEMNPQWNAEVKYVDRESDLSFNFVDAVCFASFILAKKFEVIEAGKAASSYIEEAKKNEKDHIIVLERYVPYVGKLNPDTEYVIFPSNREEGFNLSVMKDSNGEFIHPLPTEWYGYTRDSGDPPVKGMIFCHHTGFLAVFESVEDAINAVTATTA